MKKQLIIPRVMWRFTIVIYIPLTLIISTTYLPAKWIGTGTYKPTGKLNEFMYNWGSKIF